jgi:hypothetical protein
MSPTAGPDAAARTFRLPALAYLIVLFLLLCVAPLAFATIGSSSPRASDSVSAATTNGTVFGPRALLLLIPIAAIVFIARTATVVNADGIRVRALFGTRRLAWTEVRGLSVEQRSVYAVCRDGSVRLPCVRVGDLAAVAAASGGHLPQIAQPTPKFAPSRKPRPRRRPPARPRSTGGQ